MSEFEVLDVADARLAPATSLDVAREHLRSASLDRPAARAHRDQVLGFLADHDDAAHRANVAGHLTGSALVVDASRGQTALMLHRKLGRWFQPGGHADGDTNLAGVALREAAEETGLVGLRVVVPAIDIDVHEVAPPGEAPHLHLDVRFLVIAPAGAELAANEESLDLRWVGSADLAQLQPTVDPSTRWLVARGLTVAESLVG